MLPPRPLPLPLSASLWSMEVPKEATKRVTPPRLHPLPLLAPTASPFWRLPLPLLAPTASPLRRLLRGTERGSGRRRRGSSAHWTLFALLNSMSKWEIIARKGEVDYNDNPASQKSFCVIRFISSIIIFHSLNFLE